MNGQVKKATAIECSRLGGKFAASKSNANKQCRSLRGYCCSAGKVDSSRQDTCAKRNGQFFSKRTDAEKKCNLSRGFCLTKGIINSDTQGNCKRSGGRFFLKKKAATTQLGLTRGYCCQKGVVSKSNQKSCTGKRGSFSTSESEAKKICDKQNGYCLIREKITTISQGNCRKKKGSFFLQRSLAEQSLSKTKGYCCSNGSIQPLNYAICKNRKGTFSQKRWELTRLCKTGTTQNPNSIGSNGEKNLDLSAIPSTSTTTTPLNKVVRGPFAASDTLRTNDSNDGLEISAMNFIPSKLRVTTADGHFLLPNGQTSKALILNSLEAKISCGIDNNGNNLLHSATITFGNTYTIIDNLKEKVDANGHLMLTDVVVAHYDQFIHDYLNPANTTVTIPVVLTRTCAYEAGITGHRLQKNLQVDFLGPKGSVTTTSETKKDKFLAGGYQQIDTKLTLSAEELAAHDLTLGKGNRTSVPMTKQELLKKRLEDSDNLPKISFTLSATDSPQSRTYWYVGNSSEMADEFLHAPGNANPTPVDAVTLSLSGEFKCDLSDHKQAYIKDETTNIGTNYLLDTSEERFSTSISFSKEKIKEAFCFPGSVYFNQPRNIKLKGQIRCQYPDGTVRSQESELKEISIILTCDRRRLENKPSRETVRYKHECGDDYVIKGTNKQFIYSEKGLNNPETCIKL